MKEPEDQNRIARMIAPLSSQVSSWTDRYRPFSHRVADENLGLLDRSDRSVLRALVDVLSDTHK